MSERVYTISIGEGHPSKITRVQKWTWAKFAGALTGTPPVHEDKAARGWYCPVEFDPVYRDSDNFVARHALTLDCDHVPLGTWERVIETWSGLAFCMYTTASHTPEKPRFRIVMPLSRPVGYDEFQAIVRKVATDIDIELFARESFTPAQMMFLPTVKPGHEAEFKGYVNDGDVLDADEVLAEYVDWTDHQSWPHRADGDGVHKADALTRPDEKPGIIGDFCRAIRIPEAIRRFELPYVPTQIEDRWTYTAGSRPEGAVIYDEGLKLHSHHDTDPARGQNNAFDLVRLHKFLDLDSEAQKAGPVTERPSYAAMCRLWLQQPEAKQKLLEGFEALPPLSPAELATAAASARVTEELVLPTDPSAPVRFTVVNAPDFSGGPALEWIIKGVLPRAGLAVIYGESGAGKSFLALDISAAITRGVAWRDRKTAKGRVVYVCAEGAGGFRQRLRAYAADQSVDMAELPAVIADAPNMLKGEDVAAVTQAILSWAGVSAGERAADVIVVDTLAAASPGSDENSGKDVGQIIAHCGWMHKMTGALVVLIHHSGKDASKGARGWSGLKGAMDAELQVTRNGDFRAVESTKLKDGADGTVWPFKLKTVVLGIDSDGDPLSSCVIEHTDEMPQSEGGKQKPTGKYEPLVLEVLRKMVTPEAPHVDQDDLLDGAMKKLAKEGDGKDNRKRNAKRGLDGLLAKHLAYMKEGRVSLSNAETADDAEFDGSTPEFLT
jgi:hypothetical protein